ncbi:cation/calcium exchanger 5 isoform X2 [Mangifera indica]|uniref:cation/calcium exchanger 5 isoform X2 n=1 Tax=Mangifera indica TaxID=29780 RepID=UPI001CFB888A|nr:cation/calcium exchanger 5 isoform X2 [Mangifera indica]
MVMAMAISFASLLKTTSLILTLLAVLFFFLFTPRTPQLPRRSLLATNCTTSFLAQNNHSDGLFDYFYFHICHANQNHFLSIPSLSLLSLLFFYILIKTAQSHFSLVTTQLSTLLNLSPSMAAVTLLALGNGSPDIFSSVVALRTGQYRTGFGAILSAGAFVSAFVVGFVAIYAAPFSVDAGCFVRDVGFYLVAALFLFYVYLSGEIFVWQAVGFIMFYVFFVGIVFWMDLGMNTGEKKGDKEMSIMGPDCEVGEAKDLEGMKRNEGFGFAQVYGKVSKAWELPVTFFLKLTIPETDPSKWSRFYSSANIALCPLLLLYVCNSFMPIDHPIAFLLPNIHFPLWFVVLLASTSLAALHFIVETEPPKTEQLPVVVVAFLMSVFWISTVAGELLNCLAALGTILELPPAILGLTVLAWGNSVGDLVADVAVAKAGHPTMAMAGCFAGPMFNMLIGLGSALVMQTANVHPEAYQVHFHIGIVTAFVFLLLSLMGSLLVITWSRFRVPRFWGFCLVGLYVVFTAVSLVIAKFSG